MFNLSYKTQRILILFGFLTIPVLLSLTFSYYPALSLLYYSFTDWSGLGWEMNWVGFDNYKEIFSRPEIFGVFKNNAYYFVGGLLQTAVALYFAIVLTSRLKGRNIFRSMLFIPYVLHSVAIVIMFRNVYHVEYGSLNLFLEAIGLGSWQQQWLGNPHLVNFSLAFISIWKYFGLTMVIFIGALQSIPADNYEAAKIDGASGWQTLRFITLPSIRSVLELMLILTLTGALEAFDIPYIMMLGANDTHTFVSKTVDMAFKFQQAGLASAMAVVLVLIVIAFIILQRKLLFREEK
ncbi:carbohydrate ABC transporter permease [Cohnella sp. GbtcB17]|uniref:carbohydrate ABC transporter permease n=1 Tax=Cohnella sp. GbtcB17 TaxID=2824762 RepID=UPI001C30F358|nr:sugar ABC transporter permease [Cohnella sp. GbtcB17]